MKLILLRHAKSGWDDPTLDDHDRRLTRRGQEAAAKVGAWLRAGGHVPDLILCSSARRTRQTAEGLALPEVRVEIRPDLYLASADRILMLATRAEVPCVMMLGHNPGMAEAAAIACAEPPAHPSFDRYPTAACTVIDAGADLPGKLVAFTVPRDL